ncbi:hypothetical protein BP6252_10065 [Coleophoma cylindrospora]|uniref:Uncharacterized protein n=1 Tax=Coleophoma cylindrospora TaxID=1849047 RepID=A0A3D8QXK9_9HELO|nr:hypothetical protein BP6252_10065 [Coleophoma cylindrospora]
MGWDAALVSAPPTTPRRLTSSGNMRKTKNWADSALWSLGAVRIGEFLSNTLLVGTVKDAESGYFKLFCPSHTRYGTTIITTTTTTHNPASAATTLARDDSGQRLQSARTPWYP